VSLSKRRQKDDMMIMMMIMGKQATVNDEH